MRNNGKGSSFGYLCEVGGHRHVLPFHYVQHHVQRKIYAADCTFCCRLSIAEPADGHMLYLVLYK
ncbi:hypothetical protein CIX42_22355 [Salmonella enterica subsp. enterica serovar Muenchen]|uniref:Uncharacterized protein n=1 Tax=Salmonella muenchen TaxID=596 RepID=A0A735FVR1_SALMU|nr:hypothetical protein [Salmonella enterica]EDK2610681.1 hypothetical protein [Salmonella enterica subsp. enterica serovar Muenchen]HAE6848082.1 hypothetical protein [Salmonella enterica subsp. enterica serovar Muenchen]